MNREELKKIVEEATVESDQVKKLSCSKAHQIAEESDARLKEIGQLCNEEKIRIFACQLGCFE